MAVEFLAHHKHLSMKESLFHLNYKQLGKVKVRRRLLMSTKDMFKKLKCLNRPEFTNKESL